MIRLCGMLYHYSKDVNSGEQFLTNYVFRIHQSPIKHASFPLLLSLLLQYSIGPIQ